MKRSTLRPAFFNPRVLITLLVCAAAAGLTSSGTLLALSQHELPGRVQRTLTLQERVWYQRAIEEVYWRHRIWPKENADPKPSLDAVMSQAQLEKKVKDYLGNSQALADYWQRPITAQRLQAEMDRMAEQTKQPEVLHELFQALGDDPFVIAECLARPILAERLLRNQHARLDRGSRQRTEIGLKEAWPVDEENEMPDTVTAPNSGYSLPRIADGTNGCTENTWRATPISPTAREYHTAVWTGTEMIVWGGLNSTGELNTGARYNPNTNSWTATSTANAPITRWGHTAVWTGSEMIVWGGAHVAGGSFNTGGRYNPSTDSWTATSTTNAPSARYGHTAVWTGSEMIVWGNSGALDNTGGKYNPNTNSWTATSTTNAPSGRVSHTAVWSGSEMIVWGGSDGSSFTPDPVTGGRYNPSTDSWMATSTTNVPHARWDHTAVWTGTEMIVWGGFNDDPPFITIFNDGGKYNPSTNSWTATSINNVPEARYAHNAVWTGSEMIIWGGHGVYAPLNTGAKYNPQNGWTSTSATNAPTGRDGHTAVWTGSQMIVWGGCNRDVNNNCIASNTGGRYCAQPLSSPTPSPTPTPTPSATPASRLGNISARAFVETGDNVMIGGFIVQGPQSKRVIVRAIGPELSHYGVPNALANPTLELHNAAGALIASNNNWATTIIGGIIRANQVRDIQASGYAPSDGRESAIIADLPPGRYTAIVRGVNDTTGVGLVEVYDLSPEISSTLRNISARSFVQIGDNVMISGFIVTGADAKRVIVRAIGPDLAHYGVPNALINPTLELYNRSGALIAHNDNWMTTILGGIITRNQVQDIRDSGHAPRDPRESAIVATLQPGNYTAIVRGVNNTTGVGLVEVYDLD